jgi:capsular exopolysaccharide synthesis family protein
MNKEVAHIGGEPRWVLVQDTGALGLAAPRPNTSSEAGSDLNLATIWRIVLEWRWLILGAVALGLAGALVMTLMMTPLYRAQATLEINPPSVEVMEGEKERQGQREDARFLATQYGLLESRSLASRVAQDMNLAANAAFVPQEADRAVRQKIAVGKLQQGFDVDPVPNSRLIRISYTSDSPALAAQVVNSYARNFINANLERRYEASSYARDFLARQIAKVKGDLEKSERQVVAYAQNAGIVETGGGSDENAKGGGSSLEGSSLVALNNALAEAQTKRIAAEQRYRQSRSVGTTAEVNESTAALRQQVGTLEAEYQDKRTTLKPMHPDLLALRARIDELRSQINAEMGRVTGGRSNSYLAEYRAAAAEENSLRQRVAQLRGSVLNLRGKGIQYNILQREVDTNRSLYDALLQRYKQVGVAGGIGTNSVSVVDNAEVPGGPFSPNLPLNLLVGLGLGLLTGIGAALGLEFVNDTIKSPDDVRDKLHVAPLGSIPKLADAKNITAELEDRSSAVAEAYFSLVTSLRFSTDRGAPKSLLVTSAKAGEGKSSTTLALAMSFARLGNSVLLIDGDLRKPVFSGSSEKGLSILLTTDGNLAEHTARTKLDNLCLMTAGAVPPNPAELLASPRLKSLIKEAMEQFDIVIVDGPPVLGLADAPLLSATCQSTLMVIESRKTRTKAALNAIARLKDAGGHLIGGLVTKFPKAAMGYGYGYGYEPYQYIQDGSNRGRFDLLPAREA